MFFLFLLFIFHVNIIDHHIHIITINIDILIDIIIDILIDILIDIINYFIVFSFTFISNFIVIVYFHCIIVNPL